MHKFSRFLNSQGLDGIFCLLTPDDNLRLEISVRLKYTVDIDGRYHWALVNNLKPMNLQYYLNHYKNHSKTDLIKEIAEIKEYRLKKNSESKNKNILKVLDYQRRWKKENPEKHQAKVQVGRAIKKGILIKQPCIKCGDTKVIAHHPDYDKPLDVMWLCRKDHRAIHYGN